MQPVCFTCDTLTTDDLAHADLPVLTLNQRFDLQDQGWYMVEKRYVHHVHGLVLRAGQYYTCDAEDQMVRHRQSRTISRWRWPGGVMRYYK